MWTLGLLDYPTDEEIDNSSESYMKEHISFSCEILVGAQKIKDEFNLKGEIKSNIKMGHIEIGNVYLTPEQCLDF